MFGELFALLPLIGKVAPFIAGLTGALTTPVAGTIMAKAADIAKAIFGTTDTKSIELQIQEDKSKLEAFKAQLAAAVQEDLAFIADTQNARSMMLTLQGAGSKMAWGAPIISAFVMVGFFIMLAVLINYEITISEFQKGMVVPMLGILTAAAGQVINYWLGSTRQSKDKDNMLAAATATTAAQQQMTLAQQPRMFS